MNRKLANKHISKWFNNDQLQSSPSFMAWRRNSYCQQRLREALAVLDLNYAEYVVLAALAGNEKRMLPSQGLLVAYLGINKMVVSQTLAALQKKHLVIRFANPILDKREVCVRLSPKGFILAKRARKIVEQIDQQLGSATAGFA